MRDLFIFVCFLAVLGIMTYAATPYAVCQVTDDPVVEEPTTEPTFNDLLADANAAEGVVSESKTVLATAQADLDAAKQVVIQKQAAVDAAQSKVSTDVQSAIDAWKAVQNFIASKIADLEASK